MAISWTFHENGSTRYNDEIRIATEYDPGGVLIGDRPYTAAENARADEHANVDTQIENKSTIETNLEQDLAAMQAIKDQTNADLRADPSQEIKELATAVRRLIKMSLNDFTEPE